MQPDGTKLRDYVYLGTKLIAVDGCITASPPGCSEREWYHTDTLGTPLARTNSTGTVTAQFDYRAWGEAWTTSGTSDDRRYNGRAFDPGTGFSNYGARMYWPQVGRFVSADTYYGDISQPAALNRYAYTRNNPHGYVDPTGEDAVGAMAWASKQPGSTNYSYASPHRDIKGGRGFFLGGRLAPKCNVFVGDALKIGGDPALMADGRVPVAKEWADPSVAINGYVIVPPGSALQSGDILSDGHHVGIYSPFENGSPGTISAADREHGDKVTHSNWGFKRGKYLKTDEGDVTVRRFVGDPAPTRSSPGDHPLPKTKEPRS